MGYSLHGHPAGHFFTCTDAPGGSCSIIRQEKQAFIPIE